MTSFGRTSVDFALYLVVRIFICVVQAMRLETCHEVARWLSRLATDVIRLRRDVIDENLWIAYPTWTDGQRRQLTRQMWEHLFLMVAEIAHAPRKIHASNWHRYIRVPDEAKLRAYLEDGRPKVLVCGHFGNFELSGYLMGLWGLPPVSVARPLDNRFLHEFLNRFRGSTGQSMLPKNGSSAALDRALEAGGLMGVLGDQAAGPKGCWTNFFGHPASTHKAVAVFALANNAPMLVGYARRVGGPLQYEVAVEAVADPRTMPPELADVRRLTEWHVAALERIVRRNPEQYWWLHRRWKGGPPPRRESKAA